MAEGLFSPDLKGAARAFYQYCLEDRVSVHVFVSIVAGVARC